MKTKWLLATGIFILILTLSIVTFADSPIRVFVNGAEIKSDVPPTIIDGRVMMPIRLISEALGASVAWDEGLQTVRVSAQGEVQNLLHRLNALEPEQAKTIDEDYRDQLIAKFLIENKVEPLSKVLKEGKSVTFSIVATDDKWKRPAYYKTWHSTFMGGKYSNIQSLVFMASHNFYTYHGGNSEGSGLLNLLGLEDVSVFNMKRPNKGINIIAIKANIKEVKLLGNQVVVVTEPKLAGYQSVWLSFDNLGLSRGEPKPFLLQYVTPDGYELEQDVDSWPSY